MRLLLVEDPVTSLCMVRKCRVNRILLLVHLIWYCALFYSRAAWQLFSINKAKPVRAFLTYCKRFPKCTAAPRAAGAEWVPWRGGCQFSSGTVTVTPLTDVEMRTRKNELHLFISSQVLKIEIL